MSINLNLSEEMFGNIEKSFVELLDTKTLADCISEIGNEIDGNP